MKKIIFIIVVCCSLIACSKETTKVDKPIEGETLHNEIILSFNETKTIGSENMSIKFTGISPDSRCPSGPIVCFWGGEVMATLEITINSETEIATLKAPGGCFHEDYESNGPCPGEEKAIMDYQFKLIGIDPYPDGTNNNGNIEEEDYTVTFMVTK